MTAPQELPPRPEAPSFSDEELERGARLIAGLKAFQAGFEGIDVTPGFCLEFHLNTFGENDTYPRVLVIQPHRPLAVERYWYDYNIKDRTGMEIRQLEPVTDPVLAVSFELLLPNMSKGREQIQLAAQGPHINDFEANTMFWEQYTFDPTAHGVAVVEFNKTIYQYLDELAQT